MSENLSDKDHAFLVEIALKQAVKAVNGAVVAVSDYGDFIRQRVERETGVQADDPRVIEDPAYARVLDVFALLLKAEAQVRRICNEEGTDEGR